MRRLSLRARLALLALAGVLPFIGFNLGSAWLGYREARARTSQFALDLAHGIARSVEAELRSRIGVLQVLALSRPLATGDDATFRTQAEAVIARLAPRSTILLLRPDGQPLLSTSVPAGQPLPPRQQTENERRVLDTGLPSVSDVYQGVVGWPVIAIEVPVPETPGPLILAMNPAADAFDGLISRERPGPEWSVAVVDRAGVRVTRVPDADLLRARPATAEFLEAWRRGASQGVHEMRQIDGTLALTAYARIPEIGWGVAVALPVRAITDPAWHEVQAVLATGLILLLLMLGLARWLSLGIMRPILELLRLAAREEREEGAVPEGGLGLPEADRLAHALLVQARRRRAATAALVESERRLRLVVAELNHRAKNALATVQALALQTARGDAGADPTRFTEAFTGRLQTLARAHDLLTALSWEGAALGAVVEAGLAPWLEAEAGAAQRRLTLRCDCDLPLPLAAPGQVQALVMALHELATNATKHGALSVPEGRVEVSCQADVVQSRATVLWRERGGPPVPGRPARGGFGTRLLERAVARDLGPEAQVVLDYAPEGLSARISFSPRLQPGTVPAG